PCALPHTPPARPSRVPFLLPPHPPPNATHFPYTTLFRSPDVVQIGWSFKNYYKDNFEYTSPEEIINQSFPEDKKFIKEKFDDKVLKIAQDENGEQLGLPYSVSSPVMFINKDILRKAHLDANGPKTWE